MYTYTEYYNILDWELEQVKDGGDSASQDSFKKLPSTEAKRVINDARRELVGKNYERFEQEIIFRFFDPTESMPDWTEGYYDIDITNTELVSGNIFKVPADIAKYIAFKDDNSKWNIAPTSSLYGAPIYSPAHNKIYNEDGWLDGDTLSSIVVRFPTEIKETISAVSVNSTQSATDAGYFGTKLWMDFATDPGFKVGDIVTFSGWSESTLNTDHRIIYRKSDGLEYIVDTTFAATAAGTVALNYESRTIDWMDEYIRLLTLDIKRKAYSRKGKAMSQFEWIEYNELLRQWINDTGRVKQVAHIAFKGYGFGK